MINCPFLDIGRSEGQFYHIGFLPLPSFEVPITRITRNIVSDAFQLFEPVISPPVSKTHCDVETSFYKDMRDDCRLLLGVLDEVHFGLTKACSFIMKQLIALTHCGVAVDFII